MFMMKNVKMGNEFASSLDSGRIDNAFLSELNTAILNTDAMKISEFAGHLRLQEPELSQKLQLCADNFDYETIQLALQKIKILKDN
jgi:hypothetical protein